MKIKAMEAVEQVCGTVFCSKHRLQKSNTQNISADPEAKRALNTSLGISPCLVALFGASLATANSSSCMVNGSKLTGNSARSDGSRSGIKVAGRTLHCIFSKCSAKVSARRSESTSSPRQFFKRPSCLRGPFFKYLTAFQPCDATKFSNQSALSLRTATWTVFLRRFSSGQFPFSLAERLAEINLRVPELIHGRFATGTLTGTTLATDEFTLSHQPSQAASMSTSTGLLAGTACSSKAKRCCVAGSFKAERCKRLTRLRGEDAGTRTSRIAVTGKWWEASTADLSLKTSRM